MRRLLRGGNQFSQSPRIGPFARGPARDRWDSRPQKTQKAIQPLRIRSMRDRRNFATSNSPFSRKSGTWKSVSEGIENRFRFTISEPDRLPSPKHNDGHLPTAVDLQVLCFIPRPSSVDLT